jgi:hypothetical protein
MHLDGVRTRALKYKAERAGFEPAIPCGIRAFQARALGQLRYLSGRKTNSFCGTRRNYNTMCAACAAD